MDFFQLVLFSALTFTGTSLASSVKIVRQGDEAIFEMLGKYDGKKLEPGLSLLIPFIEQVAYKQTLREQILEMRPIQCLTLDRISVTANFLVYWRLTDIEKAYYKVQNLKDAMMNLLILDIRTEIAKLELEKMFNARERLNQALVERLDVSTEPWGVKITRVEMMDFSIGNNLTHEGLKTPAKSLNTLGIR